MRLGLIGLGRQGRLHLEAARRLSMKGAVYICGVCDLEVPVLQEKASYLKSSAYVDFREFIEQEELDLAILALPNDAYAEVVPFCMEHRVNTLKEKPFGRTMQEADMFRELAQCHGVLLAVAQERYFSRHYVRAKEWIDEEKAGNLVSFEHRYTLNDLMDSWYWSKDSGGGCWLNAGWHMCFVLSWFFGKPQHLDVNLVSSSRRSWRYETDDTVILNARYGNGPIGSGYISVVDVLKEDSFAVRGTEGTIHITNEHATLVDNYGGVIETVASENELDLHSLQIQTVLSSLVSPDHYTSHTMETLELHNLQAMEMIQSGLEQSPLH